MDKPAGSIPGGWVARVLPGGIRARLVLLIALVLLPLTLLLGWICYEGYHGRREQALQTELEVARGVATTLSAYVDDVRRLNFAVGQGIITLSPYSEWGAIRLLTRAAGEYRTIRNLSWVSAEGIVRASSEPRLVGRNFSIREYFRTIVAGAPWAIGDLTATGLTSDAATVGIATAIRDEGGTLRGVVVAGIEPTRLGELTLTQQRPAGGAYSIFDRQGTLVYRHPERTLTWEERVSWRGSDQVLRQALQTGEAQVGAAHLPVGQGECLAARVPIPNIGWIAGASRPTQIAMEPVRRRLVQDGVLALIIASLAFASAFLLAHTIAGPLRRLERDAQAIGAGGIGFDEDLEAPTEVRRLRQTVAEMAADLLHRARALQEHQEELKAAKETAEVANRTKDSFLVNMSHELRTPMTVIMTSLELLLEARPSSGQRQFVEMADSAAHRLLGIIDDLLDISSIEAGELKIEERPFDLRQCVRESVEMFAVAAREKGLRLSWEVAPHVPAQVKGDAERVGQVLTNVVGNAVKFSDRGEVAVSVATGSDAVVFTVRDSGIGIPAEKLDQLFEAFTQVDDSMTRRHGGTGLGLAICRELVELMGGTIRAESEEGRGSTFTFTLPLPPAATGQLLPAGRKEEGRPIRVMVAEDEPTVRQLVRAMLARRGWDVALAENGREAVARWEEGGIDLVLMDLQMPGLDGVAATRIIRERENSGDHIPIVALTAHVRPEDRDECLAAGMDGFLTKPIRMEELFSTVESCLDGDCSAARTGTDLQ